MQKMNSSNQTRFTGGRCLLPRTLLAALLASALQATAADVGVEDIHSRRASGLADDVSSAQSMQVPRWTASLEAIALNRTNGGVSQPLTNTVPAEITYAQTRLPSLSSEAFNSNQFAQGFEVGPKITLNYRDEAGHGLELSHFSVRNLHDSRTTGPNGLWLTMYGPGVFWQTQDFPNQGFIWSSASNLNSAEVNAKKEIGKDLRLLAGFRWFRLDDSLSGAVSPSDEYLPAWKTSAVCNPNPTFQNLLACAPGQIATATPSNFSTFWMSSTANKLLGVQIGAEGALLSIGKLSLGGSLKAGVYSNRATQNSAVSMAKKFYYVSANSNRAAYAAEGTVEVKYQVSTDLAIRLGYSLLWLDRVALAPGQISKTLATFAAGSPNLMATGVNTGADVLFHGGTLGLEYSF